ncbi:autotransporter outer membrane beta-barrel domain-containing protein [Blastomonas sp. AAP53]|uniref:autotransporter outer membrane beta-barrel domain-containing protein n=1 Tax=Blastomonas sp. AAP53 TaxID=1248760 RepID=UPI000361A2B2|nr:autotransporter outer membrane beta-barrel domain-containing protein [Blastomonas sp. AAP53]
MLMAGPVAAETSNGQTVTLGSGDDSFTVTNTPATGTFDGGAGNDTLILGTVAGRGIFAANVVNFETLRVSGQWALAPVFSPTSIVIDSGAGLYTIVPGALRQTINNNGIFSLSQNGLINLNFLGTINGSGTFIKNGSGTLSLGGQSYTGQTYVADGTLNLTGNLTGSTSYYLQNVATLTSALAGTIGGAVETGGRSMTNYGTIGNGSVTGRAIDLTYTNTSSGALRVENFGTISSFDDAIRQIDSVTRADSTTILNSGLIQSINGGQAIDLSQRTGGTRQISNFASGTIRSIGSSAILGAAVVNTSGLIRSDAGADSTVDAIDFGTQPGSQFYVNAGGLVSGVRNGINGGAGFSGVVDASGAVFGRNGAGVSAAGTLFLTNRGTITGWADSISTSSEGDGIRALGTGNNITNFGIIQSFGARGVNGLGQTLTADAVVINGGTITNQSGGILYGPDHGILVDNGAGGGATAPFFLTNVGAIGGGGAPAIRILGSQADTITNNGIIRAYDGGIAVDLGAGNDTFIALFQGNVLGTIDGGAGDDLLLLNGSTGTVATNVVNVERMRARGVSQFNGMGNVQTLLIEPNSSLTATTRLTAGAVSFSEGGSLTLRQDFDGIFTARLLRGGPVNFAGVGTTRISTTQNIESNFVNVLSGILDLGGTVNADRYTVSSNALATSALASTFGTAENVNTNLFVTINAGGQVQNTNASGSAINVDVGFGRRIQFDNAGTINAAGDAVILRAGARIGATNAGLIQSTGNGRAIVGVGTARLDNASSGVIMSNGGTAVVGFEVRNQGVIMSTGGPDSAADGVLGVIDNFNFVSGARNGVMGSQVINRTSGTIIGKNGAGVVGTSSPIAGLTNHGTITGGWDGVSNTANGDGIFATNIRSIYNSGRIRGTGARGNDSGGRAFTADGIEFNGGTVVNDPFAEITGLGYGILASGTTNLTNRGLIGGGIAAINFAGANSNAIDNYGVIRGDSGTAIILGAGNDTLNLFTGQSLIGLADGGGGTDVINLRGTGSGTIDGAPNFEKVNILEGGIWTLTNMQLFSTGTRIDIASSSSAIFEVPTDVNFAGFLSGAGGSTKRGAGTLFINTSGYTGSLTIEGGAVSPTAALAGLIGDAAPPTGMANPELKGGPAAVELLVTSTPAVMPTAQAPAIGATPDVGSVATAAMSDLLPASSPIGREVALASGSDDTSGIGFVGGLWAETAAVTELGVLASMVTMTPSAIVARDALSAAATMSVGGVSGLGAGATALTVDPSIVTVTIGGDYRQMPGTRYIADTSSDGRSDLMLVGGRATIEPGAVLDIIRDGGRYAIGTRYVVLAAQGGVTGNYTLDQTEAAGTEFRLLQATNAVLIELARSRAGLLELGATGNQQAAAKGLGGLANGNLLYNAITLVTDDVATRSALNLVSGEPIASARTVALQDARGATNTIRARLQGTHEAAGLWMQISGRRGHDDATSETAWVRRSGYVIQGGYEYGLSDTARIGLGVGYSNTDAAIAARQGSAGVKMVSVQAYTGGRLGLVRIRGGISYGWTENSTRRSVTFTGFGNRLDSRFDGNALSGFAEIGIPLAVLGGTVEPFAGIESHRVTTDAFAETGGATALSAERRREAFTLSTVGLHLHTPVAATLSARSRIGWEHAFSSLNPTSRVQLAGSAVPFTVAGAPLSRDAALASIELVWQPTDRLTISSGYAGILGSNGDDSTLRLAGSLRF